MGMNLVKSIYMPRKIYKKTAMFYTCRWHPPRSGSKHRLISTQLVPGPRYPCRQRQIGLRNTHHQ